jgi:Fic family protein
MTPFTLPPLPPLADIETKAILKAVIPARAALAELKTGGRIIPDDALLITNLTLLEAKDSSEIENIFTTHDALFRADALPGKAVDLNVKEVQRYRAALWHGVESIRRKPLATNTFVELFQHIKETNAGIRTTPGIRIADGQGNTIYTPPEGEATIRTLLANLETFLHADNGIDPLIKMAVGHYQFEAIHPFTDGNGRTGRIINILYLLQEGLLDTPVLFLSRYIIDHKADYYRLLRDVTEQGAWEAWVLYMLKAVDVTARETIGRIHAISDALQMLQTQMRERTPKIYSKDFVELLFSSPYTRIHDVVEAGIAKGRITAGRYLQTLAEAGLLVQQRLGKETIYLNMPLITLLAGKNKPVQE